MNEQIGRIDLLGLDQAMDASALTRTHYMVFFLCFILFVCNGYCLQALALAVPLLAAEWRLPADGFGLALAAAVAGMGIMSLIAGSLGDRIGRRPCLILAAVFIAIGSLGSAMSTELTSLTLWRLLAGFGLGFALPNSMALIADFVPMRRRVVGMTLLGGAMSAGTIAAGLLGPALVSAGGWKLLFIVGGIAPIPLALAMYFWLDESPKFLAKKYGNSPVLAAMLGRMNIVVPEVHQSATTVIDDTAPVPEAATLRRYLPVSIPYWIQGAVAGMLMFLLINWAPVLFVRAGASEAEALRSVAFINGGGFIAGLVISLILDRSKKLVLLVPAAAFALSTVVYLSAGTIAQTVGFSVVALLLGFAVGPAFITIGLASRIYPSQILATAIGISAALSSLGGVVGPLAGGVLISRNLSFEYTLGVLAAPALSCLIVAVALHLASRGLRDTA